MTEYLHKIPVCDCAEHGAFCRGRQEGKTCMAKDKWYVRPCDNGECPGPMDSQCCHKPHYDANLEDA